MRKELEIPGLEALGEKQLVKTNGGAKGGQSAAHSNAKTALTAALAQLNANGANAKAIAAVTKALGKHP